MTFRYPKETYVRIECDRNTNKRFRLTLDNRIKVTRRILMIFMNPSKADAIVSDRTINNAYKYFAESDNKEFKDYNGIEVLNLIPVYETESSKLHEIDNLICEINNQFLTDSVLEDRIIILAYGNAPTRLKKTYIEQTRFLLSLLEGRTVYHIDELLITGNPRHACYWQLYMKMIKAEVREQTIIRSQ